MPRCPKGTRRNKKTGECEERVRKPSTPKQKTPSLVMQSLSEASPKVSPKAKSKRCPKGTRRNKKTGNCESTKKMPKQSTPYPMQLLEVSQTVLSESSPKVLSTSSPKVLSTSSPKVLPEVLPKSLSEVSVRSSPKALIEVPNAKQKRCPKGTRRNKKTGECEPQTKKHIPKQRTLIQTSLNEVVKQKTPTPIQDIMSPPKEPSEKQDSPVLIEQLKAVSKSATPVQNIISPPKQSSEKTDTPIPITYMLFHSKSKDVSAYGLPKDAMRRLSNFSNDAVLYDGNIYQSIEHAYQAQKYVCSNKPELVKMFYDGTLDTAEKAKSAGGKGGMKKHGAALNFNCWSGPKSEQIMRELVQSKVERNADIRNILDILKKNNIHVVHFSRMDMDWGAHMNDAKTEIIRGHNKLGAIYNKIMYGN